VANIEFDKMKELSLLEERQCLSIARFQQNPIAETLRLWKYDSNPILELHLHKNQKQVSQKLLL